MPMPIIPKRRRSLAATGRGEARSWVGFNSIFFAARDAPAAAAPISRNLRRENLLMGFVPRFGFFLSLLLQLLDCYFLEKHDVIVAMVLQADVAFEWS